MCIDTYDIYVMHIFSKYEIQMFKKIAWHFFKVLNLVFLYYLITALLGLNIESRYSIPQTYLFIKEPFTTATRQKQATCPPVDGLINPAVCLYSGILSATEKSEELLSATTWVSEKARHESLHVI